MKSTSLSQWINENAWAPYVRSHDINVEAIGNLSRLTADDLGPDLPLPAELAQALHCFIGIRRQLLSPHKEWLPITVYVWHDEPAGALCISAVSGAHGSILPFTCRIRHERLLLPIVTSFLASCCLDGIPWDDLSVKTTASDTSDVELSVYSDAIE